MDDITDEECIGIAMLHAKDIIFHQWELPTPGLAWGCWDCREQVQWRDCSGPTKAAAARKYCERHNLLR